MDAYNFSLAQLRHAYAQLASESVVNQREFADGLIAPVIRALEEYYSWPNTTNRVAPGVQEKTDVQESETESRQSSDEGKGS